ncbi:MAG: VTT domain-containing protein [Deltaproteobacteria bacterium]|nr:VTT domain-containing protein [Deltaproteobacteria bacterium]
MTWTRRSTAKLALVLVVAGGLLALYLSGVFAEVAQPRRLRQTLIELGPWGYAAFVGAFTVLQPFGVPGTGFILVAPLIWPWPVAFALSMTGTMAASVVGFSFARFVARDWVTARIPERFKRKEGALARRPYTTVFLLRLVLWMPPPLHAFFGISRVSFAAHFWGSLAGYTLPLLAVSYFGEALFDLLKEIPLWGYIVAGSAVLTLAAIIWWVQRGRLARRTAPREPA